MNRWQLDPDSSWSAPRHHVFMEISPLLVFVAAKVPLVTDGQTILGKRSLKAFPHEDCRVIAPAFASALTRQNPQYLFGFETLLAQPLAVQNFCRPVEAFVWQKRLNQIPPCSANE